MFFIGVFGIEDKQKSITTQQNLICPICERYGRYEIFKSYTYFHFFFIPTFRWNVKYYLHTNCCSKTFLLDPTLGNRIEKGEDLQIKESDLTPLVNNSSAKICPSCGKEVNFSFRFCPFCGKNL